MRRVLLSAIGVLLAATASANEPTVVVFRGTCDASGAIPLSDGRFVTVDDEREPRFRLWTPAGGSPSATTTIPGLWSDREEPDLEGGAVVGGRTLWIGSHGRNSKGEWQPQRHVVVSAPLDAVTGRAPAGVTALRGAFTPVLRRWGEDHRLGLDAAFGPAGELRPGLAAERGGINIEGIAHDPSSGRLLVGFRNPVPDGRAIIAPVTNAETFAAGGAPVMGAPLRPALDGRGLRDMAWVPAWSQVLLLAGPSGDGGGAGFALYRLAPTPDRPDAVRPVPWPVTMPADFRPEAIVPLPDAAGSDGPVRLMLLGDDGDRVASRDRERCQSGDFDEVAGTCSCKNIRNRFADEDRTFRGIVISIPR